MKIFTIIKRTSERVPDKNFRTFNGEPLWYYSLKKFESEELFINSDCLDLFDPSLLARFDNITLIERDPEDIAREQVSTIQGSPVESMLGKFIDGFVDDITEPIVLTHVTSPFLKLETISLATEAMLSLGYESAHSVQVINDFVFMDGPNPGSWQPMNYNPKIVQRTQDLSRVCVSNGAFFILTKKAWSVGGKRMIEPCHFQVLDHYESIEIDTESDFSFAERLAEGFNNVS